MTIKEFNELKKKYGNMTERDYVIRKRQEIYDEMCKVLTLYEERDDDMEDILYEVLVKIQNNWEAVITAQEG